MLFKFSFFVDEKYVTGLLITLAGKARELEAVPVINAKKKGNGVTEKFSGNLPEMAMAEIRKQGLKEVNAKSMRDIVEYVGGPPQSYYHVIRNCIRDGALKKMPGRKGNIHVRYAVQPVKA